MVCATWNGFHHISNVNRLIERRRTADQTTDRIHFVDVLRYSTKTFHKQTHDLF